MADLCTPILASHLVLCFASPICQPSVDNLHTICEHTRQVACPPEPQQFNCVRADGAHYIWQPPDTEGSTHQLPTVAVDEP